MSQYKCAFSATLVGRQFHCDVAEEVVRRGGPEIACNGDQAHLRCEALFERMKAAALPAFGVEDDLLSMPHSVLVKIQFGGLLGLKRALDGASPGPVDNVRALVERAAAAYGEAVPCQDFVGDMTAYQLKRRR